ARLEVEDPASAPKASPRTEKLWARTWDMAASRAVVVPWRRGNVGIRAGRARQNRKRVRPPGSVPNVTIAERGSMRYTFHGGGPCDGALNGAVMPDPLSSGSAGQPLSAHAFATRATALGSVT